MYRIATKAYKNTIHHIILIYINVLYTEGPLTEYMHIFYLFLNLNEPY